MGPPKIESPNYTTDKNVENKHARFAKILEKEGKSGDQGIRFLVNQLGVNKSVYDAILSKSRVTETDRATIDMFYKPTQTLLDVLISDAQAPLRNELKNYNEFLRMFYKTKVSEKRIILSQYERQLARTAKKGTKTFTDAKTKFMKLGMTEAQANAEIAKIRGFLPNAAPMHRNDAADAVVDARVSAALKDLFVKLDTLPIRPDILRATRTAKTTLATAMNQYARNAKSINSAENNPDVNAYLANLEAKHYANMAARMPMVPTTVPRVGGKRKTRRQRKMRNVRKTRRA